MHRSHGPENRFDVIVLGAGMAGSALGAILAKNGADVLLVDAGTHPRFAVGESTTPHTLVLFKLLARRYGVPELETFSSYERCVEEIGTSFGVKRNFGFMLHREGEEPDPGEVSEFNTPTRLGITSHLFRQDSDAYLFHAAVRYGCVPRQGYRVVDVDLRDDGVTVTGQDGSEYHARFLVDASGFRSPLAEKLALREQPSRFKHHSRSLFTHMVGVTPAAEALRIPAEQMPPVPWDQGTMHHMFERGWFWVIPFNNEERSTNPLVSVGLTLDERLYPKPEGLTPEEDFRAHADRFPAVRRIFENAVAVRPWVSTGRLQYSATRTAGARWCLMSHAAGFLDPLFSRGLSNTAEVVNALSWRLLAALAEDDFTEERFAPVEHLEQSLLDFNDNLVNSSFTAFSDYTLWNAVFRIWGWGGIPGNIRLEQIIAAHERTGDRSVYDRVEDVPTTGLWWPDSPTYLELFQEMTRRCEDVQQGRADAAETGRLLLRRISESGIFAPSLGFADPEHKFIEPSPEALRAMARWMATEAPAELRPLGAGFGPPNARPAAVPAAV